MKLRIIDYGWGIDRKTGARMESVVADVAIEDLKVGPLPPIGSSRVVFNVEEIREDAITLFLNQKAGSREIKIGQVEEYRPLSMDGGHFYRFELE